MLGRMRVRLAGVTMSLPRAVQGGGGRRGCVRGWSRQAARRHTDWLQSVDARALDGHAVAFTLTMRDLPPTAAEWVAARGRFFRWLRHHPSVLRFHWVLEWQQRYWPDSCGACRCAGRACGAHPVPHLHGSLWLACSAVDEAGNCRCPGGHALTASVLADVLRAWSTAAGRFGVTWQAQQVKREETPELWARYLAKHSARSVRHYQREGMPQGWTKTGRVWGHWGEFERSEDDLALTYDDWVRVRRLVRSYSCAAVRAERARHRRWCRGAGCRECEQLNRRTRITRRLLRHDRVDVRGVSEWIPAAVVRRFMESLGAVTSGWDEAMQALVLMDPIAREHEAARRRLGLVDRAGPSGVGAVRRSLDE